MCVFVFKKTKSQIFGSRSLVEQGQSGGEQQMTTRFRCRVALRLAHSWQKRNLSVDPIRRGFAATNNSVRIRLTESPRAPLLSDSDEGSDSSGFKDCSLRCNAVSDRVTSVDYNFPKSSLQTEMLKRWQSTVNI